MSPSHDIAILGAGGYTGRELLVLLDRHPHLAPVHITSDQHAGKTVGEVFPDLAHLKWSALPFARHADPIPDGIPVFLATPNQQSAELAPKLRSQGRAVVDLSGSFRLKDPAVFQTVYGFSHPNWDWTARSVFGLPELFREEIRNAHREGKILANPGCYPTSVLAALLPLRAQLPSAAHIVVDSKSGVSGAGGRVEDAGFAFAGVYENFRAYKILKHQHEPEILAWTNAMSGSEVDLVFTPHLLPVFRGILSTIVILWKTAPDEAVLLHTASELSEKEPFLRMRGAPEEVELRKVQHTNFVDFGLRTRGNKTVIVSAIDNLVKGAAGQAIQNLNLMLDLPETAGLLSL